MTNASFNYDDDEAHFQQIWNAFPVLK